MFWVHYLFPKLAISTFSKGEHWLHIQWFILAVIRVQNIWLLSTQSAIYVDFFWHQHFPLFMAVFNEALMENVSTYWTIILNTWWWLVLFIRINSFNSDQPLTLPSIVLDWTKGVCRGRWSVIRIKDIVGRLVLAEWCYTLLWY